MKIISKITTVATIMFAVLIMIIGIMIACVGGQLNITCGIGVISSGLFMILQAIDYAALSKQCDKFDEIYEGADNEQTRENT